MSINKLEKTFENNLLIYCNLNNEIIIECICFTILNKCNRFNESNENFIYFMCDKVKIITIYDIYKNIILRPIQTDIFKDPIKINEILENLNEKNIIFFKTFIETFLIRNRLNGIRDMISIMKLQ